MAPCYGSKICSEYNNSSQSGMREEDDVEVHVSEEEEGDSSQNCHPLEVPPLAGSTNDKIEYFFSQTVDSLWAG